MTDTARVRRILPAAFAALLLTGSTCALRGEVLEVQLGKTVKRTWEDVEKDGFAYGPKQEYDAASGETRIWLPYGPGAPYYEVSGLRMTKAGDSGQGGTAIAVTPDGETSGLLTYKLRFSAPVGAFRIRAGWSEWGAGGGVVGGAEYSLDGENWIVLREVTAPGIVEPLLDPASAHAEGFASEELYIRFFSRDKANPSNTHGPNRWMKIRLSGDPAWGDRATTFAESQISVWVKPADGSVPAARTIRPKAAPVPTQARTTETPLRNSGPWAVASGAEWSGEYPRFNPMLSRAGIKWLRLFPEWQNIQPARGQWNWASADSMAADARANGICLTGVFAYFAPWASADGGTRRGPVKDMQFWRDYVRGTVARYRNDIAYWEVWNEFNGSFYQGNNKPAEYAELTRAAYEEAKKISSGIKIGISVANFDLGFLDSAIKAGAAGHFDFVCVHPYENTGMLAGGGEADFLSLADSIRQMLKSNGQDENMPLWITETGFQSRITPDAASDELQKKVLLKAYILSIAQGFERVFWFEARGPSYGADTDHGLIRRDWTPRPAYTAMSVLTRSLGENPKYKGWVIPDRDVKESFGFVFENNGVNIMAAWAAPGQKASVKFDGGVSVEDFAGNTRSIPAGVEIPLTETPALFIGIPDSDASKASANAHAAFPWGSGYGNAGEVSCRLGAVNTDNGITQKNPQTTAVGNGLTETWRKTDFSHGPEGRYVYFRVDSRFSGFGRTNLEITVVARRTDPRKNAGMNLCYESLSGYRNAPGWFGLPEDTDWHEYTWTVTDANFVGGWGWNFRTDSVASPGEVDIREVRVRRIK